MKIPKTVNISGHTIIIKQIHNKKNLANFIGRLNTLNLTIDLNMSYSDSLVQEAFFHELLHAIDQIYDLGLGHIQVGVLSAVMFNIVKNKLHITED